MPKNTILCALAAFMLVCTPAAALTTASLQKAIDRTSAKGGGVVSVPAGHWHVGRIELKSGVELRLEDGCYLHFSGLVKDYLPVVFTRDEGIEVYSLGAFIYAHDAHDIAVTGDGHIVGPGTDCEIYRINGEKALNAERLIGRKPLEERIFDGKKEHFDGAVLLPKTIAPINCRNVRIEGITCDSSLYWNIVPQYCDSVVIRSCTVNSFGHGRTDGIDIESSRNVLVEYCTLDCQDDNICIKSGRGWDGLRVNRPTENVEVRYCTCLRGASGIVCGTETSGSIRNIYCHDCVFDGTDHAVRIKSRRTRGGIIEKIRVERIKARNIVASVLCIDLLGSKKWEGELSRRHFDAAKVEPVFEYGGQYTPVVRSIYLNEIEVDGAREMLNIKALPEKPAKDIFIGNSRIRCGKIGKVYDVELLNLKDVAVESADTVLYLDNTQMVSVFEMTVNGKPVHLDTTACRMVKQHQPMRDTEGKPIQAHAFQIIKHDSLYYWYGEDKSLTIPGSNVSVYGVRCYTSPDFKTWTDRGRILEPDNLNPLSPLHYSQKNERPHILYCAKTGKYVMWLKSQSTDGYFVVCQADKLTGPYRYVRSVRPLGFGVGDFDMWADPESGKGYVWFERPHFEMICCTLTDDYTDASEEYSTHFTGLRPPFTREAVAHFVYQGRHYMFTSGTTGYTPNPSQVHVFDHPHGYYETLGDPHENDVWRSSFNSQITSVILIDGVPWALADVWQPVIEGTDYAIRTAVAKEMTYRNHHPNPQDYSPVVLADRSHEMRNCNDAVYNAEYLFLPVDMSDLTLPKIRKH